MSIAANTVLRVVAEMLMPGTNIAQNVYYFKFLDDGSSNADQDVVDDCRDRCNAIMVAMSEAIADVVILGEVKVYQWDTVGLDWDEVGSNSMSGVMVNTAQMLPHGVAPVVTGRTVDPDVNGRKFWPGFAESMTDASTLNSTALTELLLAGAVWIVAFTGANTGSGFDSGVWSVTQVAFKKFVDNLIVNGIVGYQRRRKPGVGI